MVFFARPRAPFPLCPPVDVGGGGVCLVSPFWFSRISRTPDDMDSPIPGSADLFVSMKTLSKRELVRNPSLASHLKPGQSLQLEDGKEPLVLSRRKRARLTAKQIHAELDRLCEGAPAQDAQAALRDLRQ